MSFTSPVFLFVFLPLTVIVYQLARSTKLKKRRLDCGGAFVLCVRRPAASAAAARLVPAALWRGAVSDGAKEGAQSCAAVLRGAGPCGAGIL